MREVKRERRDSKGRRLKTSIPKGRNQRLRPNVP